MSCGVGKLLGRRRPKDAPFGNLRMQMRHYVEQGVLLLASRLVVAAVTINCNREKMSNSLKLCLTVFDLF